MPELRKDAVTGRWVIIAVDRAKRPSDFSRQRVVPQGGRVCPFCPGNESKTPPELLAYRLSGGRNEPGWTLRVVPHKFPALRVEGELKRKGEGMYDKMTGIGAHEVLIETPDHMKTLSDLDLHGVENLFWAFRDRVVDLKKDRRLQYVLLFKNHGEAAGSVLEHTHSQLIALPVVPKRVQEELDGAKTYFDYKERCVYCDILLEEVETARRIVLDSEHFLGICPYAARFPFETWILPKRHESHFENLTDVEVRDLAAALRTTLRKLDKTLEQPPYNFVVHTAPVQDGPMAHYHWHIEIIPKLTRVAGFEWGSGFYLNPTPPEESATFLKEA
ncbi:MAG: galactose-1-phosphate uridylyltransferase [Bryobacteraceae bacterium]